MSGLFGIIGILILAFGILIFWLHVNEYRPGPVEKLVTGEQNGTQMEIEQPITILSFNIGYGALSKEMDFVMDGGKMSYPDSAQVIHRNMEGMVLAIEKENPDILLIQEIDRVSKRSYYVDQVEFLEDKLEKPSLYATNFRCGYVPFPIPGMLGKVESGLAIFHHYPIESAFRIALPGSFKWPVRLAQLKRCLLVETIPLAGTDKKLVLINLHLEAYDDGGGRAAQTQALASLMKEEWQNGNYVIAGGDWNQTFPGADPEKYPLVDTKTFVAGKVDREFWNQWEFFYDEETPTSRLLNRPYDPQHSETQYYVIDGFAVSPNIQVVEVKTLDHEFQYSDHNPVVIKLWLKQEEH
jgi:endonuclease/exonuclease/phosphatase family metal-dependent hydrolase